MLLPQYSYFLHFCLQYTFSIVWYVKVFHYLIKKRKENKNCEIFF